MNENAEITAKEGLESAASEALRIVDEVRELLSSAPDGDSDIRRAAVEKLHAARETLQNKAKQTQDAIGGVVSEIEDGLQNELDEVESWICKRPLGTVLAAGVVGLLIGLVVARRR